MGNNSPTIGSSFPPLPTGATALFDAAAGVTIATGVSAWVDQSGNGNNWSQATGAKQPTVTLNAITTNPAVTFDGAAQFLAGTWLAPIGAKTIWCVRKLVTVPVGAQFFTTYRTEASGNAFSESLYIGAGQGYSVHTIVGDMTSQINGFGDGTALDTSWHASTDIYTGGSQVVGSYAIQLDGVTQTTLTSGAIGYAATNVPSVGARCDNANTGTFFAPLQLAYMGVWPRQLSAGDLTLLNTYRLARFGF